LFVNSPGLFADFHALHRLLMPRHPPYALSSLATFIERSRKRQLEQCLVSRLHIRPTLRFVQATGEGRPGRVTLIHNLRTKKESCLNMQPNEQGQGRPGSPQNFRTANGDMLSKDATLATLPNCQRSSTRSQSTGPAHRQPNTSVCQWTEADKAELSVLEQGCLTSLWPLLGGGLTDERPQAACSFSGNEEYSGLSQRRQFPR
jgi:hypothetical protein